MKRYNDLYDKICSIENIELAHKNAKKGKSKYKEVIKVEQNKDFYFRHIRNMLIQKTYRTSPYTIFKRTFGKKERVIYKLPYFPDRIVHHCIVQVLEPIWVKLFINNTYSSIKNRGVHKAVKQIQKDIKVPELKYCLKLDIKKFYPSIDHEILKQIIRKKIKDKDLLELLDSIIESAKGVPIGNYLSQFLGNLYLTYFDHWIKEELRCRYYYRYCDDMVILSSNKEQLHIWKRKIEDYLNNQLKLSLKDNYQVFNIEKRGLDFLGYVFFINYTKVRKSIKINFIDSLKKINSIGIKVINGVVSYRGWFKYANAFNLWSKYIVNNINSKPTPISIRSFL